MRKPLTLTSPEEIAEGVRAIRRHLQRSVEQLQALLASEDPMRAFYRMKFEQTVVDPFWGEPENLLEAVNQCQTYLVSFQASAYLFQRHPDKALTLSLGNVPGFDIQSADGTIVGECFAATSCQRNGKLRKDLRRLAACESAREKYLFFHEPAFSPERCRVYAHRYPGVVIVPVDLSAP